MSLKLVSSFFWDFCLIIVSILLDLQLIFNMIEKNMTVLVKIEDSSGTEIWSFIAEDNKGFVEMAAMHGIEILASCNTGFCGVCLCDCSWETNTLSIDKMGEHTFELPFDENNNPKQILACVGGIKSEYFDDDQEHVVVLKKMY